MNNEFNDSKLNLVDAQVAALSSKISRLEPELDNIRNNGGNPLANWLPRFDEKGTGESPKKWAFGVTVSGIIATIQEGSIYIQGVKRVDLVKSTLSLPSSDPYVWVTVQIPKANVATASFEYFTSRPTPDNTNVYRALVRLKNTDTSGTGNWVYDGDGYILHRGDIDLSNPIVFQ